MRHADRPEPDLVWSANPPFRFDNVRYLDTGYGKTPEQMLEWNPRQFYFYDGLAAAEAAERWVGTILWPTEDQPPTPLEPRGLGILTILDSRIGSAGGEPAVVWMRFEVRLSVEP